MATPSPITIVLVTPERVVLERDADLVVLTASDGEVGILPNHAPLVARLGAGELRISHRDGKTCLYVEGGFAQVRNNNVTILATVVREIADLKPEKLEAELAEVSAQVPPNPAANRDRTERLNRIRAALRLARRGKTTGHAHA